MNGADQAVRCRDGVRLWSRCQIAYIARVLFPVRCSFRVTLEALRCEQVKLCPFARAPKRPENHWYTTGNEPYQSTLIPRPRNFGWRTPVKVRRRQPKLERVRRLFRPTPATSARTLR